MRARLIPILFFFSAFLCNVTFGQSLNSDAVTWLKSQSLDHGTVNEFVFEGDFSISSARIQIKEAKIGLGAEYFIDGLVNEIGFPASITLGEAVVEKSLRGGVRVFYQQFYQGYPVFEHGIWFTAFRMPSGAPIGKSEDGKRDIYPLNSVDVNTTPLTTDGVKVRVAMSPSPRGIASLSIESARSNVPAFASITADSKQEFGVYGTNETGFIWAYRFTEKGYGKSWRQALVSASDGEVLDIVGVRSGIDAHHPYVTTAGSGMSTPLQTTCTTLKFGDVFPNAPGIDSVTDPTRKGLTHLCAPIAGVHILDGKFVKVTDSSSGGSDVSETTGDFEYPDPGIDFDEVQAYYHATQFNQWMETNWQDYNSYTDYTISFATIQVGHSSGSPYWTSSTLLTTEHDAGGSTYWMQEGAIIAHEMYHNHELQLQSGLVGGSPANSVTERYAIGEGLADFWGIMYRKLLNPPTTMNTKIGAHVDGLDRELDDTYSWFLLKDGDETDYDGSSGTVTDYDLAMVISASLWEYYEQEGQDALDVVQIGVDDLSSTPSFMDLRSGLATAANGCYSSDNGIYCCSGGDCDSTVITAFNGNSVNTATQNTTAEYYGVSKRILSRSIDALDEEITLPKAFVVDNFPNPFNESTVITAAFPDKGDYSVRIVDILGRTVYVESGTIQNASIQTFKWSPEQLSSGIYYYSVSFADQIKQGSLTYLK